MQAFENEKIKIGERKAEIFMTEVAYYCAEEDLHEFEAADLDETVVKFPEEFHNKILQEMGTIRTQEQKAYRKAMLRRTGKIVAIFMLCFALISVAMVSTVDAFRMRLADFIIEENGSYYDIRVMATRKLNSAAMEIFPEEWEFTFYPAGLPQGFELVDAYNNDHWRYLVFENGERFIRFSYVENEYAYARFDKGEAELSEAQVGKHKGLCVSQEARHIILWNQSGYSFRLNTDLPFKDGVKIAEDVVYIDLT